jgi:hypothetical protein
MQPPRKRITAPVMFVDYVNVLPGAKHVPPNDDEESERLKAVYDKFKEFAKTRGLEFKLTKGDEQ